MVVQITKKYRVTDEARMMDKATTILRSVLSFSDMAKPNIADAIIILQRYGGMDLSYYGVMEEEGYTFTVE